MNILTVLPDELEELHTVLLHELDEVAALGPEWKSKLLNDHYYLEAAFRQNDVDKLRVFKKLAASFRTRIHLVESVVDILRDDLGYGEAAPEISAAKVEAYRIVLDSFRGLGGIPAGYITRATVRAVEAPEEAKALAARIRKKQFV